MTVDGPGVAEIPMAAHWMFCVPTDWIITLVVDTLTDSKLFVPVALPDTVTTGGFTNGTVKVFVTGVPPVTALVPNCIRG